MFLALDLGTRLGWCAGNGDALPRVDYYDLPKTGPEVGRFLVAFEDWFGPKLDQLRPDEICFEAPILPKQTQIATTRKLQGLAGVTEMLAHRRGIECREASTSQVKKALSGNGRAQKPEMVAAARSWGLDITTPDEADAFGVWVCAIRARRPKHAHRWDPLMRGAQ